MFNSDNFNDMTPGYYWFFNMGFDAGTGSDKIIKRIVQIIEFKESGISYNGWIAAGKYVLMFGDKSFNKIDYLVSFGDKKYIKFITIDEPKE